MKHVVVGLLVPAALAVAGLALVGVWVFAGPDTLRAWFLGAREAPLVAREPNQDGTPELPPPPARESLSRPVPRQPVQGDGSPKLPSPPAPKSMSRPVPRQSVQGDDRASELAREWPCFRGPEHDGLVRDSVRLARQWPAGGPPRLWMVPLCEGFAAAAVSNGRVYVLDYEQDKAAGLLRGLPEEDRQSLAAKLKSLQPGEFEKAEALLRRLFPTRSEAGGDEQFGMAPADYVQLKSALRQRFTVDRDKLVRALGKLVPQQADPLDEIDESGDVLRCLSLEDGREIWRNGYRILITSHESITRTIPALVGKHVITIGPKCQVACWDAETGQAHWLLDMVLDFGAKVPEWYTGQCPLVDEKTDRLILAPGGKDALLVAVDYKNRKPLPNGQPSNLPEVVWQTPNPRGWSMTHSSIMPMEFAGRRMYVYCASGGVLGVDAEDGQVLWETSEWQVPTATCPSPVIIGDGRIFLCGGYNSGSLVLQLSEEDGEVRAKTLYRLSPSQFGSEQQTPVLWDGHLYGVRQRDKRLVCLDLDGNEQWNSGSDRFGSSPYLIADGLIYALNDNAVLTLAQATPTGYKRLARAEVVPDVDKRQKSDKSWGPMAMVAGRLIVRDLTRMACLDVAEGK